MFVSSRTTSDNRKITYHAKADNHTTLLCWKNSSEYPEQYTNGRGKVVEISHTELSIKVLFVIKCKIITYCPDQSLPYVLKHELLWKFASRFNLFWEYNYSFHDIGLESTFWSLYDVNEIIFLW